MTRIINDNEQVKRLMIDGVLDDILNSDKPTEDQFQILMKMVQTYEKALKEEGIMIC